MGFKPKVSILKIEGKDYVLEFDPHDPYVVSNLALGFCFELAQDYMPVFFDPKGYGSRPFPPDIVGYRIYVDFERQKLCILYEVYWRRQDCNWQALNKDHDHDYEQIQVQFDLQTERIEKVVVSSVGPVEYAGHGIEVYRDVAQASVKDIDYITSSKKFFPWGGDVGQRNLTQIREIPITQLFFEDKRPAIIVVNCYHAFVGVKRELLPEERIELKPELVKLDEKLLDIWYYRNAKNRYGHDISKPFEEPCIMYYPPPEDFVSRFVYTLLWLFYSLVRVLKNMFRIR